jgi:CMP/dCMP kinase
MGQDFFAITISHQVGSSGAPIGKRLSERLNIPFFDREILKRVSGRLHMAEADLEHREERLRSFWQTYSRTAELMDPALSLSADQYDPTDKELFQLESEILLRIAEKTSAVFIGRCGRHILRDHPRHIGLMLCADPAARIERIKMLYRLGAPEAESSWKKTTGIGRPTSARSPARTGWMPACTTCASIPPGWEWKAQWSSSAPLSAVSSSKARAAPRWRPPPSPREKTAARRTVFSPPKIPILAPALPPKADPPALDIRLRWGIIPRIVARL